MVVGSGTARMEISERRGARVMMRGGKGAHGMVLLGAVTMRAGGKLGERGGSGDGTQGWGFGSRVIWGMHIAERESRTDSVFGLGFAWPRERISRDKTVKSIEVNKTQ